MSIGQVFASMTLIVKLVKASLFTGVVAKKASVKASDSVVLVNISSV